jgi:hypothetical protein
MRHPYIDVVGRWQVHCATCEATKECHVALSDWPILAKENKKWLGSARFEPPTSMRIF